MTKNSNILLAFYGDDLTGSTDALEFICKSGLKTVLFLEPPTSEQLNNYPDLQAYGVAGLTRSLSPELMEKELIPAFTLMKETGARHVHYKVCSTFDSSPLIGSIGKAIDCGMEVFKNAFVPVLGGMPALGRYCAFGNLFAVMGIGSQGRVYRLDRHPSMSTHPVTPSDESDLRIHLGKQTKKRIGLIDVAQMQMEIGYWDSVIDRRDEVVLLDAMNDAQLKKIGEWLESQAKNKCPLFSVGSSGIEMALGSYWNSVGEVKERHSWPIARNVSPLLVISGSCSPVTKTQIEFAVANGFQQVVVDVEKLSEDENIWEAATRQLVTFLQTTRNVIVHTGEKRNENLPSSVVGQMLGRIAKDVIAKTNVKRIIVAGGDTSSYAARAMEIEALEMIAPFSPGAPLCRAYSKNKMIDGMEINLKGGQVGDPTYFVMLKEGKIFSH